MADSMVITVVFIITGFQCIGLLAFHIYSQIFDIKNFMFLKG